MVCRLTPVSDLARGGAGGLYDGNDLIVMSHHFFACRRAGDCLGTILIFGDGNISQCIDLSVLFELYLCIFIIRIVFLYQCRISCNRYFSRTYIRYDSTTRERRVSIQFEVIVQGHVNRYSVGFFSPSTREISTDDRHLGIRDLCICRRPSLHPGACRAGRVSTICFCISSCKCQCCAIDRHFLPTAAQIESLAALNTSGLAFGAAACHRKIRAAVNYKFTA